LRFLRAGLSLCLCGLTASAGVQAQGAGASSAAQVPAAAAPAPAAPVTTADEAQRIGIARALFDEGLRFVDAEQWSEAANRFARVLEIRYSAVAAYNFALAQARLGKLLLAAETLRKLTGDDSLDAKVRDPALALRKEVDAKLGWLTLQVTGTAAKSGAYTLRVDDREWPEAAWGVAAPIDPGAHSVVLSRGSQTVRSETVAVAQGGRVELTLEAEARAPSPAQVAARSSAAQPAEAEPSDARDHDDRSVLRSPWLWIAAGALVVGAITVGVVASQSGDAQPKPVKGDFGAGVIQGTVMR
jgi:hypothetical protein